MKIAFDWGGVLSDNKDLRNLSKFLYENGCEVYLIGVVFESDLENRKMAIKNTGLEFTKIFHIIEDGEIKHGDEKLKIMKEIGCNILIDDSDSVVERISKENLTCLKEVL